MVNRTGRGAALPTLNRNLPALVRTPQVQANAVSPGANAAPTTYSFAQILNGINARVQDRLDVQAEIAGREAGRLAGQNGVPDLQNDATIRGRAFNTSARDAVATEFDLNGRLKLQELEETYQSDPLKFKAASDAYLKSSAAKLQGFDPEIAQHYGAEFQLRQLPAINRITDRQQAIIRDRQQERALRLQMQIQDELQQTASGMFDGDPAAVRQRLEQMTASAARLADVAGQIGPNGQPLFTASQRLSFERAAEDMVGEAFGMAWMRQQDSPIAAYYQWKKGEAFVQIADGEGNAGMINMRDLLPARMYLQVEEGFMGNLRADLALQNQLNTMQDRAFKETSDAVFADLSVLGQDGGLDLRLVEAVRGKLEEDKYLALRELAKQGGASVSDGQTIARLLARSADGIDVRDEARAAYAGGDLSPKDFMDVYDRSTAAVSSGTRNAVSTGRDYVGGSLGRLSTELGFAQSVSIPQAEAEYETRVQDFITKNERQPSHTEALDISKEVVRRYSIFDIKEGFLSLPLPQFMPPTMKNSSKLNTDSLMPVINQTRDYYLNKHNGDIEAMKADEEYRKESALLQEYHKRLIAKENAESEGTR